jgi:enamine deaminase RidA (YjgF/YER057c/UK114 family)
MNSIEDNLKAQGIIIPDAPSPAANYVPCIISNNLAFIAGQVPFEKGKINYTGKVGKEIDIETAKIIARICALNVVGVLKHSLKGDLTRVKKCIKIGVFVSCIDGFNKQPEVANGASDLMIQIFGDSGKHARFAVGTNNLPRNVPVEIDGIFEVS